ncbi:hypothetical protein DUNSADRAFT_11181 [Dunaliella salina]|uniref:Uncharacterized protein n=1 Tax=Dunaliella salina TaxID=3046 RepID=A0ABQ7GDX7_DUNSA|nr:hypothetical protein DUNSADRAFT_11181 [Dunaliella salina]|eukprot:KAF5832808.1 hypothetical protein DUNSADRAFT_11181 [Dunaliella salina]
MSKAIEGVAAKSAQLLENWLVLQDTAARYMANAGNIVQRMPALTSAESYSELQGAAELRPLLLAKQMKSFELVLSRLQAVMSELEAVVVAQEKHCVDGWAVLGGGKTQAPIKRLAPPVGAMLTMESMEDVWFMCRDELCLKAALVSQLHHGISEAEFASISSLFCAHVHVKTESSPVLLLRNSCWEVP